jgi:hypothetical protein
VQRAVQFKYITPSGTRGIDYNAEIRLPDAGKVNCEMKCKGEGPLPVEMDYLA